jgi:hypothetical protein
MSPPKSNLPLIPLLLGSFLFLLVVLVLKPKIAELLDLRSQIATNQQQLSFLTNKLATLKRLNDSDLKTKTEKALHLLPPQNDPANLLAVFRLLAQEHQVVLGEIKASPGNLSVASDSATPQATLTSSFNLTVDGPLDQIKNFIGAFATTPPLLDLEADLSQDLASHQTQARLLVTTYFLPLPKNISSINQPLPQLTRQLEETFLQIANFRDLPLAEANFTSVPAGKTNLFAP